MTTYTAAAADDNDVVMIIIRVMIDADDCGCGDAANDSTCKYIFEMRKSEQ